MNLTILKFQIDDNLKGVKSETLFKVYCPAQYKKYPQKLKMYNNGSVSKNVKYQNLCVEKFAINVAYNQEPRAFEVSNNSLVEVWQKYHGEFVGKSSHIPYNYEILSKFFSNYNIIINWINCNYTWGWYDYETGKWTGAVGKVINDLSNNYTCYVETYFLD